LLFVLWLERADNTPRAAFTKQTANQIARKTDASSWAYDEAKEWVMSAPIVLVVDDNPTNLKLIAYLLQAKGYDVRTAIDAESALEEVANVRPALILMDLQLPGMDGLELTSKLKADPSTRDIVVIAVTAYAMKGDEERARAAGCDGYVPKPVDTRALPGIVAAHLLGQPHALSKP
jgi:CheY-like chemotaxis protein